MPHIEIKNKSNLVAVALLGIFPTAFIAATFLSVGLPTWLAAGAGFLTARLVIGKRWWAIRSTAFDSTTSALCFGAIGIAIGFGVTQSLKPPVRVHSPLFGGTDESANWREQADAIWLLGEMNDDAMFVHAACLGPAKAYVEQRLSKPYFFEDRDRWDILQVGENEFRSRSRVYEGDREAGGWAFVVSCEAVRGRDGAIKIVGTAIQSLENDQRGDWSMLVDYYKNERPDLIKN